jgi:hypothetical protein
MGWQTIALFFLSALVVLSPLFFFNRALYGTPFTFGYTFQGHGAEGAVQSAVKESLTHTSAAVSVFKNTWHYAVSLFPWMSFAAFGVFFTLHVNRELRRRLAPYLVFSILLPAMLWGVYGVWNFSDNPNPAVVSIGDSHVRYWLPIFVLVSPLVGVWVERFTRPATEFLLPFSFLVLLTLSVFPVFLAEDGLAHGRRVLNEFREKRERILSATEQGAVVVADRADKFLWPDRRVITPLRSETTFSALPDVARTAPLYYFGVTFPVKDLNYLNERRLRELGLRIIAVTAMREETLYRISPVP